MVERKSRRDKVVYIIYNNNILYIILHLFSSLFPVAVCVFYGGVSEFIKFFHRKH
jgi:hypothetical protein